MTNQAQKQKPDPTCFYARAGWLSRKQAVQSRNQPTRSRILPTASWSRKMLLQQCYITCLTVLHRRWLWNNCEIRSSWCRKHRWYLLPIRDRAPTKWLFISLGSPRNSTVSVHLQIRGASNKSMTFSRKLEHFRGWWVGGGSKQRANMLSCEKFYWLLMWGCTAGVQEEKIKAWQRPCENIRNVQELSGL